MASIEENQTLIDDCESRESMLDDWEAGFIDSIGRQIGCGKRLTGPQEETLNKIWEKATEKG